MNKECTTVTRDTRIIPLRPCATWCEAGDGHPDATPEDRLCCSEGRNVILSFGEPVNMGDGKWAFATQEVSLRRAWNSDEVRVVLYDTGDETETDMTLDEAERHAHDILAEVASARAGAAR